MRFSVAIDAFVADMRAEGRMNSAHTEQAYRAKLERLGDVIGNRNPAKVGPDDVKAALAQWEGNSRRQAHAVYRSFFRWTLTERIRSTNPADMVRSTKARKSSIYRLTRAEVVQVLDASNERRRDRWVAHLGLCAGLRSQELRGLQGRHFARDGFVWVSKDIAKGRRERWVPVLVDLAPIVEEIVTLIGPGEYVVPGQRFVDPPINHKRVEDPHKILSASALYRQVLALGQRAGVPGRLTPHVLRHAFGDHVAKYAGLRAAQGLMGHESVETTASTYTDRVGLDELAVSVQGFSFRGLPATERVETPDG